MEVSPIINSLSTEDVVAVEIFTRESPPCNFCIYAKRWIAKYLPEASVHEYNINRDSDKWSIFLSVHPAARTIPQITLTMKNGKVVYVGGYDKLEASFSASV